LNPHDGGILALVGGYNFELSKFNRATQAERQPGSSFKPFIYAAALARGYTLSSIINDAPIVVNTPGSPDLWRPENDQKEFFGPTRLRLGLVHSLNLVSIRLLDAIGIDYALNYLKNFGFDASKLPGTLSLALGTGSVTPLQQTAAFAVFANGGYRVNPYVIDHIVDAHGKTIYKMGPQVVCTTCQDVTEEEAETQHSHQAPRVISAKVAYLITSALQDVIKSGTGYLAHTLQRPDLAGKTGTTNEFKDAWFIGYNADIVASVWAGFDQPSPLREYGSQVALPMWIDFMRQILNKYPPHTQPKPAGIISLTIDKTSGLQTDSNGSNTITEIFDEDHVPTTHENSDTGTFVDPDTGIDHSFHPSTEPMPLVPPSVAPAVAPPVMTKPEEIKSLPPVNTAD
jgi:penicillin-binding protein 1A